MRQRRHHQAEKGPAQFLEKRRAKTTYEGYAITYNDTNLEASYMLP
jgi:hypothetical protein